MSKNQNQKMVVPPIEKEVIAVRKDIFGMNEPTFSPFQSRDEAEDWLKDHSDTEEIDVGEIKQAEEEKRLIEYDKRYLIDEESELEPLAIFSIHLSDQYLELRKDEAVDAVLTGEPPKIKAVRIDNHYDLPAWGNPYIPSKLEVRIQNIQELTNKEEIGSIRDLFKERNTNELGWDTSGGRLLFPNTKHRILLEVMRDFSPKDKSQTQKEFYSKVAEEYNNRILMFRYDKYDGDYSWDGLKTLWNRMTGEKEDQPKGVDEDFVSPPDDFTVNPPDEWAEKPQEDPNKDEDK